MAFSGQLLPHILWSKPEFRHSRSILPLKANYEPVKILSQRKLDIQSIKRKSNCLVTFSMSHPDNGTSPSSPSETIKKFYSSINNNDLNQLALLISEDCFFDDFSYTRPFKGRKEALKLLEKLTTCMGKNTKFCIEQIYEGVDLTTVVNWHLEWKKKQVPFTRGCSCYELSRDGEQLIIKKAQVIIESPIKPGSFALDVFQTVISVFDTFPEASRMLISLIFFILSPTREENILNGTKNISYAGLFLMNPQVVQTIYDMALKPSIGPIIAWYRKLWSITVTVLTLIYKLFLYIIEMFHK
ncbi:uncharacterized protein LOC107786483 isoform X1 [Nicotiana tabacum]|uniref:Uncharacterized protein LOC107786483 isoform X1 n=1 Tax=Nicotiana tabacum TaxID=4097 RepID=A0A1S3ZGQ8_TOBAC|nr:PREDICTED: uncharacterized protein LOC107786483 isoform X1 [Nicotiana tabacum]